MTSFSDNLKSSPSYSTKANDILKSLDELLDNMQKNQSIISRMAKIWGAVPKWMKITGGIVVFGFFLLIGIVTPNTLFIAASSICAAFYTLISLGLDNHYEIHKDENELLKSRMLSLGDLLSTVIQKLNEISLALSTEIDRLKEVVNKTKMDFESEISKLSIEGKHYQKNNDRLALTVKTLLTGLTAHHESNKLFQEHLDRHLNDLKEGKADFFQALGNILDVEKALATLKKEFDVTFERYNTLLKKYDELVTQHEKILATNNKHTHYTGDVEQLLKGIIKAANVANGVLNPVFANEVKQSSPIYN